MVKKKMPWKGKTIDGRTVGKRTFVKSWKMVKGIIEETYDVKAWKWLSKLDQGMSIRENPKVEDVGRFIDLPAWFLVRLRDVALELKNLRAEKEEQ
jgi:hypothetical protein